MNGYKPVGLPWRRAFLCCEKTSLSTRVYPTLEQSTGVRLYGESAHATVLQFDVWELA
ncbi:GH32 C-terminal domain-containing protein [Paenibacillus sp. LPE1-1-1.1]